MTRPGADIRSAVRQAFPDRPPARLGVAVSGGGDSVALLHILLHCFDSTPVDLHVATVDHGLRPDAKHEAAWVADLCEAFGVPHSTLTWRGWDGTGNLQDQARRARYTLLTEWAKAYDINDIALGHTANDQAETLIMRLARSSGVDGLTAMSARRAHNGITLIRPLLGLERADLRTYLDAQGVGWIEDPSNDDSTFDRIKVRQALEVLEPLGISPRSLTETARHMEEARSALNWYSFLAARDCVDVSSGDVVIEHRQLRTLPSEILRRILIHALRWIGGNTYAPRSAPMSEFVDAARSRRPDTLAGCQMLHHGPYVWICREFNAVRDTESPACDPWDNRWVLSGGNPEGLSVRALGRRGIMDCPDWRETGRPYASLLSSPSLWKDHELVAAPLAGEPAEWTATASKDAEEFYAGLIAH